MKVKKGERYFNRIKKIKYSVYVMNFIICVFVLLFELSVDSPNPKLYWYIRAFEI